MKLGIDLGSATAKFTILDEQNSIVFSEYAKHNGHPVQKILEFFKEVPKEYQNKEYTVTLTGTAGMGLATRTDFKFVQEVIAISRSVKLYYPEACGVIEIGGEDAKFIYFSKTGIPDMKMNGSCAGGTGSFIEQMAALLNVDLTELNSLAQKSTKDLSIASRCGVFAKTDVQALINQGHERSDIARAVFDAVAVQYISTLIGGADLSSNIIFAGGPLTFFSELRDAFAKHLKIKGKFVLPENSRVFIAAGAALVSEGTNHYDFKYIVDKIKQSAGNIQLESTIDPLFNNEQEYKQFVARHEKNFFPQAKHVSATEPLFLGIDAGSTTTKMALINEKHEIIDSFYQTNKGEPLEVVKKGFAHFKKYMKQVKAAYTTGYGEELVLHAFSLSGGVVETFAHNRAGAEFSKSIDFILDIGGQDIKAIRLENGIVTDIDLNEACSSGTGSFIETFARTMGITLEEFVEKSNFAKEPIDLGTRCSVFMNSKVKDALREGYSVADISAGLSYSIIKNALYKVIRVQDPEKLGKTILVQGGTFKNDAVLRAFEKITGREVIRVREAHLMGALGAAIYAEEAFVSKQTAHDFIWDENILSAEVIKSKKFFKCKGCGNVCNVAKFEFTNGKNYFNGHKCEKFYSNNDEDNVVPEPNYFREKYRLFYEEVIDEVLTGSHTLPTMGLPLALEIFEHFPFYYKLLKELGFRTVVSHWTTEAIYKKGIDNQLVDNICLPAKIVNGHIEELINKGADRVFFPTVIFEEQKYKDSTNAYNCPVVTGYPEVLESIYKERIPIDKPDVSFHEWENTYRNLWAYLSQFNLTKSNYTKAFEIAKNYELDLRERVYKVGESIVKKAIAENMPLFLIAGRPYHIDPLINHGLMDLANSLGAYVISEDVGDYLFKGDMSGVIPLTQWSYHNRLYASAKWARDLKYNKIAVIQLTSFGCGPDAVTVDEVKDIVRAGGVPYINIKMDEMVNLGAVKIRVKSLLFALKGGYNGPPQVRKVARLFDKEKDPKKLIAPSFAETYDHVFEGMFTKFGYEFIQVKKQTRRIVDTGLKYVHNDMCYPAVITIGDIIQNVIDINPKPGDLGVVISETGGQCRASNYSALLRKSLADAGYDYVPVAVLNASSAKDSFQFHKLTLLKYVATGFGIADAVVRMKHATRPYEKTKGDTIKAVDFANEQILEFFKTKMTKKDLKNTMKKIIDKFNAVEVYHRQYPRVGVVGEIYLKTNDFSNNYLVEWLEDRGFEAELPGMVKFLNTPKYNAEYNHKNWLKRDLKKYIRGIVVNKAFGYWGKIIEKDLREFHRYREDTDIKVGLKNNIIPTSIQFGECWLLPLEVAEMARHGVKYVVALQPFGCISNHVVAKGMYKRIREIFPELSFLTLDFESGSTNVNIFNRLELFLNGGMTDK